MGRDATSLLRVSRSKRRAQQEFEQVGIDGSDSSAMTLELELHRSRECFFGFASLATVVLSSSSKIRTQSTSPSLNPLNTLTKPLPVSNLAHQDGILPKLSRRLVNDLGERLAFPLLVVNG